MSESFNSRLSFFLNLLEQSQNNSTPNIEGNDIYETSENILNVLERDSEFINEVRYVRLILSKSQSVGRESLALGILQIYEYYKTNRNLAINTIKDICKNLEKRTGIKNIEIPQNQQQSNLPNHMQQSSQIPNIPTSHNNFDFDRIKFELNVILLNKAQFLAFLYLQCTNYLAGINTLNKETDIPTIQNHIFTLELYRFWEYFLNHFSASLSQIDQNTFIKTCRDFWIANSSEDNFYIARLTDVLSYNYSQFVQTFNYISLMHTNGNNNSENTISSLIPNLYNQISNISLNGKNLYVGIQYIMGSASGDRNCFFHSVLAHITWTEYLIIKNYVDSNDLIYPYSHKTFLKTVMENIKYKDIVNSEQICYLRAYVAIFIYNYNRSSDNIFELQTILGMNVNDPRTGLPTNSFVGYFPLPALAISQILKRPFLIIAPNIQINNAQYTQGYICAYEQNSNWTYSIFSTNTMQPTDNIDEHKKFIEEAIKNYKQTKCICVHFNGYNHYVPITYDEYLTDVEKFETCKNRQNLNSNTLTMTQNNNQFKETESIYEKIKIIGKITGQNVEFLYEFHKKYPDLKSLIEKLYLICTKYRNIDYTKDKISELSRIYEKFANNDKPNATKIWITRILPKDLDKTLNQFSLQQPQQNSFPQFTSNPSDLPQPILNEPFQHHQQNFEKQLTMSEILEVLRKDPNIGNNVMCLNELYKNRFKAMPYVTKLFEIYKKDKKYVSDVIRNIFSAIEDWKFGKLSNDEKKADKTLFDILLNIFNDISNTHKKIFENPNQFKMQSNMPQQQSFNISNQKSSLQPKFANAAGRATQHNNQFPAQQPQQNSFSQFTLNPSDSSQPNHQQQNFEMQPSVDEMLQTIEAKTGQVGPLRALFKVNEDSGKYLTVRLYEICFKDPCYVTKKIVTLADMISTIADKKVFKELTFEIIKDIDEKYKSCKNTQQMSSTFVDARIRANQYNNQQSQQNPSPQNECVIQ